MINKSDIADGDSLYLVQSNTETPNNSIIEQFPVLEFDIRDEATTIYTIVDTDPNHPWVQLEEEGSGAVIAQYDISVKSYTEYMDAERGASVVITGQHTPEMLPDLPI